MTATQLKSIEDITNAPKHLIANNNWDIEPAGPTTTFQIGTLADRLVLLFTVEESNPRAINVNDHDPVWQDSCVEFFCQTPHDDHYFNFEFNSRGVCLASRRLDRKTDVQPLSPAEMSQIIRKSIIGEGSWQLLVTIPLALLGTEEVKALRFNCYKCGDLTEHPHFLSYWPIDTPKPDFHQPRFFGELSL